MMVSTKGRYALRVLLDFAEHQKDGYVSLKESAEREDISKKYLEQIVTIPGIARMLQTKGGKNGGYRLAKPASSYTLYEILRAAEGAICPVACLEENSPPCARSATCTVLPVWKGLDEVIVRYLEGITLQDLLDQKQGLDGGDQYVI